MNRIFLFIMDFSVIVNNNIHIPVADSILYHVRYKADKIRNFIKHRSLSEKLGVIRLKYAAQAYKEEGSQARQSQALQHQALAIRNKKSNRSTTFKHKI
jgi:hypothetical protein